MLRNGVLQSLRRSADFFQFTRFSICCSQVPGRAEQLVLPSLLGWHHMTHRGVKKQANDVRTGNVVEIDGRLLQVVKQQHTQGHGRQLGTVQFELRDLATRSKQQERRRPGDMLEVVRLEGRPYHFLYREGEQLHLMSPETYEQITVPEHLFGSAAAFLAPDMAVTVNSTEDGQHLSGELPPIVELRVAEADPYAKGDSATTSYKRCTLEGGARVAVPPFVATGDTIIVDTRDGTFVRRGDGGS